jgi:hypothetical protein
MANARRQQMILVRGNEDPVNTGRDDPKSEGAADEQGGRRD